MSQDVEIKILDTRLNAWGLPRYHSDGGATAQFPLSLRA